MSSLRTATIRLAHAHPELRPYLLPLLKQAAPAPPHSPRFEEGQEVAAFESWVPAAARAKFASATKRALNAYLKSLAPRKVKLTAEPPELKYFSWARAVQWRWRVLATKETFLTFTVSCAVLKEPGTERWATPPRVLAPPTYQVELGRQANSLRSSDPAMKDVGGPLPASLWPVYTKFLINYGGLPVDALPGKEPATPQAVVRFVSGLRTSLERAGDDEDGDPNLLRWEARDYGLVYGGADDRDLPSYESSDSKTVAEARRVGEALEEHFGPAVQVFVDVDQEWVFLSVRIRK